MFYVILPKQRVVLDDPQRSLQLCPLCDSKQLIQIHRIHLLQQNPSLFQVGFILLRVLSKKPDNLVKNGKETTCDIQVKNVPMED